MHTIASTTNVIAGPWQSGVTEALYQACDIQHPLWITHPSRLGIQATEERLRSLLKLPDRVHFQSLPQLFNGWFQELTHPDNLAVLPHTPKVSWTVITQAELSPILTHWLANTLGTEYTNLTHNTLLALADTLIPLMHHLIRHQGQCDHAFKSDFPTIHSATLGTYNLPKLAQLLLSNTLEAGWMLPQWLPNILQWFWQMNPSWSPQQWHQATKPQWIIDDAQWITSDQVTLLLFLTSVGIEPMLGLHPNGPWMAPPSWLNKTNFNELPASANASSPIIRCLQSASAHQEALDMSQQLCQWKAQHANASWSEVAILSNDTHHLARINAALWQHDIPTHRPHHPPEVSEALHWLSQSLILANTLTLLKKHQLLAHTSNTLTWQEPFRTSKHQELLQACDAALFPWLESSSLDSILHPHLALIEQSNQSAQPIFAITSLTQANNPDLLHTFALTVLTTLPTTSWYEQLKHWLNLYPNISNIPQEELSLLLESLQALEDRFVTVHQQPLQHSDVLDWLHQQRTQLPRINETSTLPAVQLYQYTEALGCRFPLVILPGLTNSRTLPGTVKTSGVDCWMNYPPIPSSTSALWDSYFVSQGTQAVWLSTHHQDELGVKTVPASIWLTHQTESTLLSTCSEPPPSERAVLGQRWQQLATQSAELLFAPDEPLKLSASSMQHYLQCPQQFFYQHLLHVPGESSPQAQQGLWLHRLLECFNNGVTTKKWGYDIQALRKLIQTVLTSPPPTQEKLVELGFQEDDWHRLICLPDVIKNDWLTTWELALNHWQQQPYFTSPPTTILAEAGFKNIALEGLNGAVFSGKIDAFIERDGRWQLVDYKGYGHTKLIAKNLSTLENYLMKALTPWDIPPESTEGLRLNQDAYIQLPLYYRVAQQRFADQFSAIHDVTLQVVRPTLHEASQPNPSDLSGSIALSLSKDTLETHRDTFLSNLQNGIIDPIRATQTFTYNAKACDQCAYTYICPIPPRTQSDNNEGDSSE